MKKYCPNMLVKTNVALISAYGRTATCQPERVSCRETLHTVGVVLEEQTKSLSQYLPAQMAEASEKVQ